MNKKGITVETEVKQSSFYDVYVQILEALYPDERRLTNREREVLISFMLLDPKFKYNRFGTQGRKKVKRDLEISYANLQRQLDVLKEKGYIIKDSDDIYCLTGELEGVVDIDRLELQLKFIINGND